MLEYNLQEMIVLEIKKFNRFGLSILDGEFPSILPVANTNNLYYLAHVKYSQIYKLLDKTIPLKIKNPFPLVSNCKQIIDESKKHIKVLKNNYLQMLN